MSESPATTLSSKGTAQFSLEDEGIPEWASRAWKSFFEYHVPSVAPAAASGASPADESASRCEKTRETHDTKDVGGRSLSNKKTRKKYVDKFVVEWSAVLANFLVTQDIPDVLREYAAQGYGGLALTAPVPQGLKNEVVNIQRRVMEPYAADYDNWMRAGFYFKLSRRGELVCMLRTFGPYAPAVGRLFPAFDLSYAKFPSVRERIRLLQESCRLGGGDIDDSNSDSDDAPNKAT